MKTIAVIGGGPAGMLAAGTAAGMGKRVYLIEKNKMLGRKLRITGKGRCNITNAAEPEEMLKAVPTNPKFLYSAFYSFTNQDIIRILEERGVKTKTERGGRVFPESDSAHDVAEALKRYALQPNTQWIHGEAKKLVLTDETVTGVETDKGIIACDSVIICTGGMSYPLTGSDGWGYALARQAGHTIISPKASLIPIVTEERWVEELMGLSLKNTALHAYNKKGKKIYSDFGEMLFTHFGISGPMVLSASAHLKNPEKERYTLKLDLKPALTGEQLDARILRDFEKFHKKHLGNSLDELLPKALIPVILRLCGLDPHKEVSGITREERQGLGAMIKGLPLTVKAFRPVEEAIITSGGVKVGEVNPSTMESKLVKGLFFAGEVLDVDAYTGGYNLQIAYATGYLAGENA